MIITKEFLDNAFSFDSIKKYAYFGYKLADGYEYELSKKWVDWAYNHLVDLQRISNNGEVIFNNIITHISSVRKLENKINKYKQEQLAFEIEEEDNES